jgi:hypothetical protein
MPLTKNEIRDRVASDYLGILELGQSLEHKDSVRILQGIENKRFSNLGFNRIST